MDIKISQSFLVVKQCCNEHICICLLYSSSSISLEYMLEAELLATFSSFAFSTWMTLSTLIDIAKLIPEMVVEMGTF